MPFGAPSVDQYGGDRAGDNLFGTSIVAADANTGKYLWHFQLVHHDIWDADLAAAPVLIDVKQGGKTIPAVAVISKPGLLFLLDRMTGKPIYGVEERPVPASEVPLERAAKTQPFPLKPPPLSRMTMTAGGHRDRDAGARGGVPEAAWRACSSADRTCRTATIGCACSSPAITAASTGAARRSIPQLGYLFVNTNELGQLAGPARTRSEGATGPARGDGPRQPRRSRRARTTALPGGGRFKDRSSDRTDACQQPPWGQLTAIDVNTGEFAWRVPLGVTDSLPPEKQKTGRPGNGGSIATAGGLVFVGATDDARFRAFDAKTGKELWTFKLRRRAQATPSTYRGRTASSTSSSPRPAAASSASR